MGNVAIKSCGDCSRWLQQTSRSQSLWYLNDTKRYAIYYIIYSEVEPNNFLKPIKPKYFYIRDKFIKNKDVLSHYWSEFWDGSTNLFLNSIELWRNQTISKRLDIDDSERLHKKLYLNNSYALLSKCKCYPNWNEER